MKILITGANGFVGREVCRALSQAGHEVWGGVRQTGALSDLCGAISVSVGNIGPDTDWSDALLGVEVVVHLAARAHVMHETAVDALAEYRRTNTAGTEALAIAAARAGVRRFVYISTIKVNGEETWGKPFMEADQAQPSDPYSVSKFEAEQVLQEISRQTGMEIVILRPPLVYGPGVKANFLRLMNWVDRGIPLPLSGVRNARSLLYIGNFADAILAVINHPAAAGKVFLLADGEAVSTPELIRRIGQALGRPAHLWTLPVPLLRMAGRITGKSAEVDRLLGSLVVDDSRIRHDLGWRPPFTLDEGLRLTAEWFLSGKHGERHVETGFRLPPE